jgi:hypothetical protein
MMGVNLSLLISRKSGAIGKKVEFDALASVLYDQMDITMVKTKALLGFLDVKLDYSEKFEYEIFKDKFTKMILNNNIVKSMEEAKKIFEVKRDDADIAILAKKLLEELRVKLCIVGREDAAQAFETQLVQSN